MEKADLLEYLKAVCEAEEAAYACEETISTLQEELRNERARDVSFYKPKPPTKVEPYTADYKIEQISKNMLDGWWFPFSSVVGGILSAILGWKMGGGSGLASIVLAFLGLSIGGFPCGLFVSYLISIPARRKAESETASHNEYAEREYRSDYEKYEMECKAFEREKEASARIQKIIPEAIAENEATRMRIKGTLERLYGLGIIYSPFQNTIAVHQIRQYLEMGLCDALDGPAGAYAEYMKDVRAQRICDSIQDMKQAVLGALNQIAANQQLLYREMRQVNEHIVSLQKSMESGLQAIQGEIAKTRNASAQAMAQWEDNAARSNTAVNKQMEEMRRILLASAQNQYIVQREQFANDWWARNRLQQP